MKILTITLFVLHGIMGLSLAQEGDLRWGEFGYYRNWKPVHWLDSEYEFISKLPDLRSFPQLLQAAEDPKMSLREREVVRSQLRTLSRCDFGGEIQEANDDADAAHHRAVAAWKSWWNRYGSTLEASLAKDGKRYEAVWKELDSHVECPNYRVFIPKVWSATISFKSGDYGGVIEEKIHFQVDGERYSLQRCYRRPHFHGETEWQWEEWKDFKPEEAERFLATLVYLIDNPWFMARDELFQGDGFGSIIGRPDKWSAYDASCDWTGILDSNNEVIMNHDPSTWDTIEPRMGPVTELDDFSVGIVYRIILDMFPDPTHDPDLSRWERIENPQDKGGQTGTKQPATRPAVEPEGGDNPQLEAEGRSR